MKALTADGRGRLRLLVLAVLVAALALTGAAKMGSAATNGVLTPTVTVLNDQSPLVLGTPTPGGNIGYDLNLNNGTTSTVNHIAFTDTNGAGQKVVYINAPATVSCSGLGTTTLSCTSVQLAAGAQFDVIVLFQTDPSAARGSLIENNWTATYSPQSNNTSNNRGDTTKKFTQLTDRQYAGVGVVLAQSLSLPSDPLNNGSGNFTANVKMPPGFLNNNPYVGVTLENATGVLPPNASTLCPTCQPFEVKTTIPLAETVDQTNNPFLQGTTTQAYTWSFTIPILTPGFKPKFVYHTDDNDQNPIQLPACQTVNGQPVPLMTAPGLCTLPPVITKGKGQNPDTATYSGLGIANGHGWGG